MSNNFFFDTVLHSEIIADCQDIGFAGLTTCVLRSLEPDDFVD